MDPITAMFLGALVLTACARVGIAATSDAIMTARASKDGQWDFLDRDRERRAAARQAWARAWVERRAARNRAAGGSGEFRPGAREYTQDLYHGFWEDRLDRRTKKREARPEYVYDPDRPSLAQRFDAAVLARVERIRQSRGWTTVRDAARGFNAPVPSKADAVVDVPPEPAPALAVDTGDVPVGTVRHTDGGRERWDGNEWNPIHEPSVPPADAATRRLDGQPKTDADRRFFDLRESGYTGWIDQDGHAVDGPTFMQTDQADRTTDVAMGGTMTAPTGEAVNYETTVAELESLATVQRIHLDLCQAARDAIERAKSAINDMQESYRASSAAVGLMAEHLAARNLDGVTLANAGTTADAMPAGVVDAMYDRLEEMEVEAKERQSDAEIALASTEANLAHIQGMYGDAHETVAGNLSGDSTFLDAGGGVVAGAGGSAGGGTWGGAAGAGDGSAGAGTGGAGPAGGAGSGTGGTSGGGNVGASAGAGETVNVSGDSVGRTNRGGAAPSGRPSPGGGDGGSSHNVGVVQSGGGRVTVGGDTAGVINKG